VPAQSLLARWVLRPLHSGRAVRWPLPRMWNAPLVRGAFPDRRIIGIRSQNPTVRIVRYSPTDIVRPSHPRGVPIMWKPAILAIVLGALVAGGANAFAWGNEGHEAIGLIAEHFLEPSVRQQVAVLLTADSEPSVPSTIRDRATWADKYRDSGRGEPEPN